MKLLLSAATAALLALTGCATVVPPAAPPQVTTATTAAAAPPEPAAAVATPAATSVVAAPAAASAPTGATPFAVATPAADEPPILLDPPHVGDDSDLWARLRRGLVLPGLEGDERVAKWTRYYADRPDYVQRMTERGGRYLFHIIEEVEKRGLPADLALLPFIESAFNPQAVSRARAAGMWQFMPATGRDFELRQNLFRDDRRDVLASTSAALDYLETLHRLFGDWHLALAAYNWGQGNVQRAIARNARAGLPTDYASLRMPDETRNYVPKLLAVRAIVERPGDFALVLPPLQNHPFFLTMPIMRDIDVALAARLAGLPLDEFQALNPQLNKPVILAAGTPRVLLPYDNAHRFAENLAQHRGPMASWTAWVAPRTLQPAAAARLVGMSEARLREVNRIPPRMRVRAGSTLLVPRAAHSTRDVTAQVANGAMLALAPEVRAKGVKKARGKAKAGGKGLRVAKAGAPKKMARAGKAGPARKGKAQAAAGQRAKPKTPVRVAQR